MSEFLTYTIIGLVTGCIYALTASGLVVTYMTTGILNFGHGAVSMVAAFAYWQLTIEWHVPVLLALILVILVGAPVFGTLLERLLMRPLQGRPVELQVVVTVGLLIFLLGLANLAWSPAASATRTLPRFFSGHSLKLASVFVDYHSIVVVAVAVAVAIGLRFFFSVSRTGVAMRAVVDNPGLAAMAGARPYRIAQFSWALGAALAALGGVLLAPLQGALNIDLLTLTVILAIVPAVIGRLRSLPLTVAGGLIIGLAVTYAVGYLPPNSFVAKAQTAIPMVILFVALVLLRQERLRSGRVTGMAIARAPSLSRSLMAAGLFIAGAAVVSELISGVNLGTATRGLVLGIAFLSLVLLTGYAGQVSLGQMTFVGTGAYAMAHLGHHGSLIGVLAAVAVSGALGALVAIFAVRLRGLYLALSTLAFAYAMDYIFFDQHFGPYGSGLSVDRLHVPGFDTTSDKGFFILAAVIFALAGVGLLTLRRGRYGRRLAALNDSPQACATLGVNIAYTKLAVFSASAALAGLAGALYGGQQHLVTSADFQTFNSLVLLLLVLLGGKNLVSGALATAVLYALFPVIQQHVPSLSNIQYVLVGLGALTLGRNPEGLGGQISRLRDLAVDRTGRAAPEPSLTVEGDRLVGADG